MTIPERSAYLKGLAEGLNLDKTKPEGRLIDEMLSLIGDMADQLAALDNEVSDLGDYIEEVDDDLADVEDYVYDEDGDDFDDGECDGDCIACDREDCPDDDLRSMLCPSCGEQIYYDDAIDPATLTCPACGKPLDGDKDEEES